MYIISKLFNYIFLPPGIFIMIFFIASFYAKKFRKFFLLSALLFWAISNKFVSNLLIYPLENGFLKDDITPKAVVV